MAPITLTGTLYNETFDNIGTALPSGWDVYTGANISSLGTLATLTTTPASWNNTSGAFKNFAAGDSLTSTASSTDQNAATDRALGIRQTGTFGDPGGSFVFSLNNTSGFQNFGLSFKAQMLDVQPRSTIWTVDYRVGNSGNFTSLGTYSDPGVFGSTTLSTGSGLSAFGTDINNQSNPVQIRISALSASTGSGNRDSFGIDDFQLTYSTTSGTSSPGVTITESGGSTNVTEGGATDDYTLVLNTQPTANVTININGGSQVTLNPASVTFTPANWNTPQTVTVTAVDDTIAQGNRTQTITQTASSTDNNYNNINIASVVANITDNDTPATGIVKINQIQGSGSTFNSAFGGTQTIEGIVVGDFSGSAKLSGFYVEEEDADQDNNPATSEGIFIYDPNGLFSGKVGDKVRVTGAVSDFTSTRNSVTSSLTEITASNIINLGASTLPTVVNIKLPVANATDLERYEGMLVNVSAATGDLTVSEIFQLGRYGQVTLAANGATNQPGTDARIDQYTQFNAPSVSGYTAYENEVAKREIILDDGIGSNQNPDPIIFARGGQPLSATNTLRGGDTVNSITGILDHRYDGYRIETTSGVNFLPTNPRPTAGPDVGGTLKVGALNVLNFFTTLDTGSTISNSGGVSYQPRGANTATEFTRQRNKIVNSIIATGADVVGLMEMENNGTTAVSNLVTALNAVAGAGTYAFIDDTGIVNKPNSEPNAFGTDAIKVALIYKPGKVTPVGSPITYQEPTPSSPIFSRPPLAQTFQQNSNGEKFSVIVNHFKSKSATGASGADLDQGDGQGAYNAKRTAQANAMVSFVNTVKTASGDPDVLVVGDLNSYAKEDPITTLGAGGLKSVVPYSDYSYVFNGEWGSLDYILANDSMKAQVVGAGKFHNNSDEPIVLDYNTEFKSSGQINSLYANDFYRASDHDPAVVGLNLNTVNNTLTGTGRTSLTGDGSNDSITGNPGAKDITGGGGNNRYIFNSIKDAGQTITDFTVGKDKIVLTNLLNSLVSGGYKGSDPFADGYVKIVQGSTANNSVLQIDRDGPGDAIFRPFLNLNNVAPTALSDLSSFVY